MTAPEPPRAPVSRPGGSAPAPGTSGPLPGTPSRPPTGAPPSTPPPTSGRRTGRTIGRTLAAALLVFVTVVLVLFVVFNTQTVRISLVFGDVEAPLVLALVIAAALGGLVVALAGIALKARRGRKT